MILSFNKKCLGLITLQELNRLCKMLQKKYEKIKTLKFVVIKKIPGYKFLC
jgi:hypothetical protein